MQNNNPPAVPAPVSGIYDKRVREIAEYQRRENAEQMRLRRERDAEEAEAQANALFLSFGWKRPQVMLLNGALV